MEKTVITANSNETKKIGAILAKELRGGEILALEGDLGAGKTTFSQGLLKGLKVKGPYTSPTFVIMKKYSNNIFHIDAYRVNDKDILDLGWEEIVSNSKNIVIIEWADRISEIIPDNAIWIKFEWIDENRRKITYKAKG